jgi:AcrR family transcriptional regulator
MGLRTSSVKPVPTAGKLRGSYHHRDLRNALLAAALEVLEREGVDFTLRELARRVGVSHAAPYAHFADKAALLAEVARIGFERLAASTSAAAERASDSRLRLVETGRAYVRFALAHPALYRLMFSRERAAYEAVDPALAASADAAFAILLAVLRELPYRGAERGPKRVRADAIAAWAQVHGLSLLMLDGHIAPSAPERRALVDTALETLADGIASSER